RERERADRTAMNPDPAAQRSPEQVVEAPPPVYRLYTPGQVTLATLLGAPIAGAALMASNARRLRSRPSPGIVIACGLAGTGVLIALAYLIPDNIRSSVLPAASTAVMYQVARHLQGARLDSHLASGGKRRSYWAAAGIGLAFFVLDVLVLLAIAALLPDNP